MSCPVPQPLSFTLPNGANTERFGAVSDSTPEDCIPHSLVNQTVTTKASNMAGTFAVDFPTEVLEDSKGQFKITFNLKDQPMQPGTYALQITVRTKDGSALKTLTGSLNIQPEAL
jgi:hypothetical protein